MSRGWIKNAALTQVLSSLTGLCFVATSAAYLWAGSDVFNRTGAAPLRLAVSENVVVGVNLNDASAAMAIWSEELLKNIDIKLSMAPNQAWVMPSDQLLNAIHDGKMDLFCLTVQEYRRVVPYVDTHRIITDDYGGDEFLLVVREGSGIVNLAGLRGRPLILWESPSTTLAEPWLAVSLWRGGLESPQSFLGRITSNTKLSQVVLPLFFGKADACLVTRRGLDTMIELNPQLAKKLNVLLASPKIEGTFFACRKDCPADLKKTILDGIIKLKSSPPAKQILTLFQSSGFSERDASCLGSANAVLDAYERHSELAAGRKRQ